MPSITLDIPEARFSAFLRVAADFLETDTTPGAARGEVSIADEGSPVPWRFGSLHPETDPELRLLVDYLKKVKGFARSVFAYLVNDGQPIEGDQLAEWLQMPSRRAVAGSLGHASRFANELGRKFPVDWDRETGRYWMGEELREAMAQARLWTVPAPFVHVLPLDGHQLMIESDNCPARYAVFLRDAMVNGDPSAGFQGLFYDRDAAHDFDPNVFTLDDFVVTEFEPDAVDGSYLVPVESHADAGTRSERSHDLVTPPFQGQTIHTEVRR